MIVLPAGIGTPKPVRAKLQPTPRITSASLRNVFTARGLARPPEPSASGCVSSKALLPSRLVVTGICQSSASAFSSAQASA